MIPPVDFPLPGGYFGSGNVNPDSDWHPNENGQRKDYSASMRSFFGGLTLMVGVGFFGWGVIFLMRYPSHGEGRTAVILGLCAILIGVILIFPISRDSE